MEFAACAINKLAKFIEDLKRGMTPVSAAYWVRQFHVDYTDILRLFRTGKSIANNKEQLGLLLIATAVT